MNFLGKALMTVALVALTMPAFASACPFEDNFDFDNDGLAALNWDGRSSSSPLTYNWTVTNGTVDLIGEDVNGHHFFDLLPNGGLYVDLDGSTHDAGRMSTVSNIDPGTYTLTFDLAGSQRGDTNTVRVSLGSFSKTYTLPSSAGWMTISETFATTGGHLTFEQTDVSPKGDNIGLLLDNVDVCSPVPELGTLPLLGGLLCLGAAGLRRRIK